MGKQRHDRELIAIMAAIITGTSRCGAAVAVDQAVAITEECERRWPEDADGI